MAASTGQNFRARCIEPKSNIDGFRSWAAVGIRSARIRRTQRGSFRRFALTPTILRAPISIWDFANWLRPLPLREQRTCVRRAYGGDAIGELFRTLSRFADGTSSTSCLLVS